MLDFTYLRNRVKEETDPSIVVYMIRGAQEVHDAELVDLAWALCDNSCSKNDVYGFLDLLEKYLVDRGDYFDTVSE